MTNYIDFFHWRRAEVRTLARCVDLRLPPSLVVSNYMDLWNKNGAEPVLEAIYSKLIAQHIHYAIEPHTKNSSAEQYIRTPRHILETHQANCLDLSLLVAGICLAHNLLPLLIMLEGHALVAVARTLTRQVELDDRPKFAAFEDGLLREHQILLDLAEKDYLILECTGSAHSSILSDEYPEGEGRNRDGQMMFARALEAGREQLQGKRRFLYALDISALDEHHAMSPSLTPLIQDSNSLIFGRSSLHHDQWLVNEPFVSGEFIGRVNERQLLSAWLNDNQNNRLLLVEGQGGLGKSALVWNWLTNDVNHKEWPAIIWWNFDRGIVAFDDFVKTSSVHLGGGSEPTSTAEAYSILINHLKTQQILIVFDGFEAQLRGYNLLNVTDTHENGNSEFADTSPSYQAYARECISQLAHKFLRFICAHPVLRARVIITSRWRPRAVEDETSMLVTGCQEIALEQMSLSDVRGLFAKFGINLSDVNIKTTNDTFGNFPLFLKILIGIMTLHPNEPLDRLIRKSIRHQDFTVQRQNLVVAALNRLSEKSQELLWLISCCREAVTHSQLESICRNTFEISASKGWKKYLWFVKSFRFRLITISTEQLSEALEDLQKRALLRTVLSPKKEYEYDIHPIIRTTIYDQAPIEVRDAFHAALRTYFTEISMNGVMENRDDLMVLVNLYYHTVKLKDYDTAYNLFFQSIEENSYHTVALHRLRIDLLMELVDFDIHETLLLTSPRNQSTVFNALGNTFGRLGQPRRACQFYQRSLQITSMSNGTDVLNRIDRAQVLVNLAMQQIVIGEWGECEKNLREGIDLGQEPEDILDEDMLVEDVSENISMLKVTPELMIRYAHGWRSKAVGEWKLGRLLTFLGRWEEAEASLENSRKLHEKHNHKQGVFLAKFHNAILNRMLARLSQFATEQKLERKRGRSTIRTRMQLLDLAWRDIQQAEVALSKSDTPTATSMADQLRLLWLKGALLVERNDVKTGLDLLLQALTLCRDHDLVLFEADILLDIAYAHVANEGYTDTIHSLGQEALRSATNCESVFQIADSHLLLAKIAHRRGQQEDALSHARTALSYTEVDSRNNNYYFVAREEANFLLRLWCS